MELLQFLVILVLLYEFYEIFSYKKIFNFEKEFLKIKKSNKSLMEQSYLMNKLMSKKEILSMIIAAYACIAILFYLLFTSVWYFSVIIFGLTIVNKLLRDYFKLPIVVRFVLDKVVSILVIGYTLFQLFYK